MAVDRETELIYLIGSDTHFYPYYMHMYKIKWSMRINIFTPFCTIVKYIQGISESITVFCVFAFVYSFR